MLSALCTDAVGQSQPDNRASSVTPANQKQVSLYLNLHAKKAHVLDALKASDLSIVDAGQAVDNREVTISSGAAGTDHLVTFLFDRLAPGSATTAAATANRIVKEIASQAGTMGIWAIDDRLRIVQPYTADRTLIGDAIRAATNGKPLHTNAAASLTPTLTSDPEHTLSPNQQRWNRASRDSLDQAERIVAERHLPWGPAALLGAADAERSLEGRKAIIYFTEDSPSDLNAVDMFRTLSEQLRDASITLYVIDVNAVDASAANGMQAAIAMGGQATSVRAAVLEARGSTAPNAATMGMGAMGFKAMNDTIQNIEFDSMNGNKNLLAQAALLTGGTYTNEGSGTRKIGRQVLADLTSYYTISYPVPADRRDGKFHTVLVKASQPGVQAESHLGYFAWSPGASTSTAGLFSHTEKLGSINELERLAKDASGTDLALQTAALRFGESPEGFHTVLALEVPIRQLDLHEDTNTELFSLHASVAAEIRNASGASIVRFQEEFHRHGAIDAEPAFRDQVLSAERSVSLPAGDYSLEAVVRDWNTGKIGRSTQTIHLGQQDGAAVLSDLVLVRATEDKTGSSSPGSGALRYGPVRVVPNLSGETVGQLKTVALYFQLYPDTGESGQRSVRVEVSKNGKLLNVIPLRMEGHFKEGSAQVANVALDAGAGRYMLAVCVDKAGHSTRRELSLTAAPFTTTTGLEPTPAEELKTAKAPAQGDLGLPLVELGLKDVVGNSLAPAKSIKLIESARERALAYAANLPNFICVERIDRASDHKGTGIWKHRDSIVELLRFQDKVENRTLLELNGEKSSLPVDHIEGAHSNGEFGSILKTIFDPLADAKFKWQKSEEQGEEILQVYTYTVAFKNSQFFVTDHTGSQIKSAFHGLVFVDNNTHSVRRVTAQTDELPLDFGVKASWMAINYDYIAINKHDYLLPTRGEVGITQGKHEILLNQLRFSDYRRFGARSRIVEATASVH